MTKTAPTLSRRPRVRVSRQQHGRPIVRTSAAIRRQLKAGAQTVIVDTGGKVIDLADADLAGAGQSWTLRIIGRSSVRIHLETPLPRTAQLIATDASFVEMTGLVALHAYTRATVHAFDRCTVYARNRTTVLVCDEATVSAQDDAEVFGYDSARVLAKGRSTAVCVGDGELFVEDEASGLASVGVTVGGPARGYVNTHPPVGVSQVQAMG